MGGLFATDDVHALAFRVRMLRIGRWPTLFTSAFCTAYILLTWSHPHRGALVVVAVFTVVGTVAITVLPIEPVVSGRWSELFFLAWSASVLAMVALLVALDGGLSSPTSALLFLPVVYSALSYPRASLLAVGAMAVGAYVGLAVTVGGVSTPAAMVWVCSLITMTWICAWQASNHAEQRQVLSEISRTDPLTECLNRRGFGEEFAAELAASRREDRRLGLITVDLDRFKAVNDAHGHAAGDDLLCWVASQLRDAVRPSDAIGRLGGDEFGMLVPDPPRPLDEIAQRLVASLAVRTGASAGIATFPDDGVDEDALHMAADAALYRAKVSDFGLRMAAVSR